jgi:nucleoside-diphosphate-sugar epimerase
VFGRESNDAPVSSQSVIRPSTVYGHTKAIGELLLSAYSKAGKVDGRCGRLATVVVRPRKIGSSAGASVSDAMRDITLGRECDVVLDPSTRAAIIGYDRCIDGLIRLQMLSRDDIGGDPIVNFPALTASIEQIIDAASATARRHGRSPGIIRYVPDPFAQSVIDGWATAIDGARANALGIYCDKDLAEICERVIAGENQSQP